jgi:molecular chaperone GrpE (heat shock protein)
MSALRGDLSGSLAYHALRDLCCEVIGPLSATEAMLEHGDFADPAVVAGHLRSLAVTLHAVLARMGAEKVAVVPGVDVYDPVRHRCVAVLRPEESPLPDAAPHTVVRVVEDGYSLNQRPLIPVRVEIQAAPRPTGTQQ